MWKLSKSTLLKTNILGNRTALLQIPSACTSAAVAKCSTVSSLLDTPKKTVAPLEAKTAVKRKRMRQQIRYKSDLRSIIY